MTFSASDLIKKSATQILYLSQNKVKQSPTAAMLEGVCSQQKVSTSNYKEMRGAHQLGASTVFFCLDEVKDNMFIEHKYLKGELEPWFLHQSLVQVAFYKALTNKQNTLVTASFYIAQGNPKLTIPSPTSTENLLVFTTNDKQLKFKVTCMNDEEFLKYYTLKIKAINSGDYSKTRVYDSIYKHRDWEYLNKFISYSLL